MIVNLMRDDKCAKIRWIVIDSCFSRSVEIAEEGVKLGFRLVSIEPDGFTIARVVAPL
jgi:hypothetical protein